jgi:hypothetical protein
MASEWHTVSVNKKRGNNISSSAPVQNNVLNVFNKITPSIVSKNYVRYSKEDIYFYKEINKNEQVSYELSITFDKINEMFKTSTQYLESKKKINYNQFNHNRWELKKEGDNSVINIICCGLNKITENNAVEIINEIKSQEILLYDDLEKLTEKIIHKCISELQFLKLYIQVIKYIMTNCKWIVDDNNMIPITFRRIFLNQLEMRFCNLINDVRNMKYDDSESEIIVIHSKLRKGLINLIAELYTNKIIGNQLIRYIFRNLENAYEESKVEQYLEYWLILFNVIIDNWIKHEKIYLDEQVQYIMSKKLLSSKLKFIIQDQFDILKSKNYNINDISCETTEVINDNTLENTLENTLDDTIDYDDNYDLIILSSTEYESLDKWFNSLGDNINSDKLLLDLLQITLTDKKQFDLVKNVLDYLLKREYITREEVNKKIEYIKNENDLSEYRYYEKHLSELNLI